MFGSGHTRSGLASAAGLPRGMLDGIAQLDGAFPHKLTKQTKLYIKYCHPKPSKKWTRALDTFIRQCIKDGNWLLFDRLWIFAADFQQNARVSIVNPSSAQLTEEGSPTWTKNAGYTCDPSNRYLQTNYVPRTNGVNYKTANCSFGLYTPSYDLQGTPIDMGMYDGTNFSLMCINRSGSFYVAVNNSNDQQYIADTNYGMFAAGRTNSTQQFGYVNGVQKLLQTDTGATNTPATQFYIGAFNSNGSNAYGTTNTYSMSFIGSGDINQVKLYKAWSTFLSSK